MAKCKKCRRDGITLYGVWENWWEGEWNDICKNCAEKVGGKTWELWRERDGQTRSREGNQRRRTREQERDSLEAERHYQETHNDYFDRNYDGEPV